MDWMHGMDWMEQQTIAELQPHAIRSSTTRNAINVQLAHTRTTEKIQSRAEKSAKNIKQARKYETQKRRFCRVQLRLRCELWALR
jgi:hypothetical protein